MKNSPFGLFFFENSITMNPNCIVANDIYRISAASVRGKPEIMKIKKSLYILALALTVVSGTAQASMFEGETLDKFSNALAWLIIIAVPIGGLYLFWMVHILPEKIAHKRHHPQKDAIQTLCLLSLVFGGMLWPFAWLWAYTKPVGYKLAYGTDKVGPDGEPMYDKDDLVELRRENERLKAALATSQPNRGA
jgi:hypothetical protein